MITTLKNSFTVETSVNWDNSELFDVFVYDTNGDLIDCDFARGYDEKERHAEAAGMFENY